ncbi:transcriptional regulator [Pyrodictium occultum]|uniref:Transcriptional regulator n=1 Tax=Pyrodictium occultum TaxID=2309 RepID=A0A0V8RUX1_PYROC|nr:ribbon-helix-helix domain-containing protein [Pyrodictium occultum]KSW11862.1 transcriptional regulator [Pyrodictium occultum]
MRLVTVKMPETYLEGLDELVKMGRYSSRSEAIRIAVRELLKRELWGVPEHPTGFELAPRREPRRVTV